MVPSIERLGDRTSPGVVMSLAPHADAIAYLPRAAEVDTLPPDDSAPAMGVAAGVGSALTPSGAGLPIMLGD